MILGKKGPKISWFWAKKGHSRPKYASAYSHITTFLSNLLNSSILILSLHSTAYDSDLRRQSSLFCSKIDDFGQKRACPDQNMNFTALKMLHSYLNF